MDVRRFRAVVTGAIIATATVVMAGGPAQAYSGPGDIAGSGCSGWLKWSAPLPTGKLLMQGKSAHGKVRHCLVKYQIPDKTKAADYYVAVVKSEFLLTSAGAKPMTYPAGSLAVLKAPATISVTSSSASLGNEYGATPTKKLESKCGNVSVGVSISFVSVSTTLEGKCQSQVTRTTYAVKSAAWKIDDVPKWETVEVAYAQTVKEGTVPKFTARFSRPNFTYAVTTKEAVVPTRKACPAKQKCTVTVKTYKQKTSNSYFSVVR